MSPRELDFAPQNLTKHFNEALILTSLSQGPKHGYQLALDIEEMSGGQFGFKHGTLYPILHKLEKDGFIEGAWSDEGQRGKRKRYQVTREGKRYLRDLRRAWASLIERFSEMIGEDGE